MSITITEKFGMRQGQRSAERFYIIEGTESESSAYAALFASAPVSSGGVSRSNVEVEEIGPAIWAGYVSYAFGSKPAGTVVFSGGTTGGTIHITQARATPHTYAASGITAADHKGAIGLDQQGNVQGCDIIVTQPVFHCSRVYDEEDVTEGYLDTIEFLTGRVNSGALTLNATNGLTRSYAALELLFLGATWSARSDGKWEFDFAFAVSRNVSESNPADPVGDITIEEKAGWDYLDVEYEQQKDDTAFRLPARPIVARVQRVYKTGDLLDLNINEEP